MKAWILRGALIAALFFLAGCAPAGVHTLKTATAPLSNLSVSVGPEENVAGPAGNYLDYSLVSIPTASGVTVYSSNATAYRFTGSSLSSIAWPAPGSPAPSSAAVLSPGAAGSFDECGAWLASVYQVTSTYWIGWYHAEHTCDRVAGTTHMTMAFVDSADGGHTWNKPSYPNNQILTAPAGSTLLDYAGNGKVIYQGGYFYLFYMGGDYQSYIARSSFVDQGRPGTWWKWYQGGWTEPGIGGQSTAVNGFGEGTGSLSWNSYLGAYLNVDTSAKWGFLLKTSSDLLTWSDLANDPTKSFYPLATYPTDINQDQWGARSASSGLLYAYPSIVGTNGDSSTSGQTFYLYYTKLFSGQDFTQRYLMRRLITLSLPATAPAYAATVDLDRYRTSAGKLRVFTEITHPSEGYTFQSRIGALLAYPAPGFHPLYECGLTAYNFDYFASNVDPSPGWANCEGQPLIRNIGWAADSPIGAATTPIYRCFNSAVPTHFISTDPACEGHTVEWVLGYIFP